MNDTAAANTAASSSNKYRKALLGISLLLLLVATLVLLPHYVQWISKKLPVNSNEHVELLPETPDILIETKSLSELPADLLKVPLLKDVLTEDLVFYYQANSDWLGLRGTLRRIAYEHQLDITDQLLVDLLNQSADVALWRTPDGKPGRVLFLIDDSWGPSLAKPLADFVASLAQVADNDPQLSIQRYLEVDGDEVALYRLRYSGQKVLHFAFYEKKALAFVDHWSSYNDASRQLADKTLGTLLEGDKPFLDAFGLDEAEGKHRISIKAHYLSFGYQQFFPSLSGLQLEMDQQQWHSYIALSDTDKETLDYGPLWQAMPLGASLCVAMPISALSLQPLAEQLSGGKKLAEEEQWHLEEFLAGPVALCWYGKSRLHSPLVVASLKSSGIAKADSLLASLFDRNIGAWEEGTTQHRFPMIATSLPQGMLWQREVGSLYGQYPAEDSAKPDEHSSAAFFRVSLARTGASLLFSVDDTLVKNGMAALGKNFPPMADQLPKQGTVTAWISPDSLAQLIEQETFSSLPADMEPVFRNAAENYLLPKLKTLSRHGKYAVTLPESAVTSDEWDWQALEWVAAP